VNTPSVRLDDLRVQHLNLRAECSNCGHVGVLDGAKLWRWFALHRWDTSFTTAGQHMRCNVCRRRPAILTSTADPPTSEFGPKTEAEWKKAVDRQMR